MGSTGPESPVPPAVSGGGGAGLRPVGSHRRRGARVSAIEVSGLQKSYGSFQALNGIDFRHEEGEVFALLGPNGAGKTTTVEILEGYRKRDGGEVRVLGEDPGRAGPAFRARIGIVLQSSAVYPTLSVQEILDLFAGYYPHPRDRSEVIELVGLGEKAGARVRTLSGGQLRRLDLGLALVGDPELVFLDEPTTGFDPGSAAPGLGDDSRPPNAREEHPPDDALHGGGAEACRPRRDPSRRPHRRHRDAGRAPGRRVRPSRSATA